MLNKHTSASFSGAWLELVWTWGVSAGWSWLTFAIRKCAVRDRCKSAPDSRLARHWSCHVLGVIILSNFQVVSKKLIIKLNLTSGQVGLLWLPLASPSREDIHCPRTCKDL